MLFLIWEHYWAIKIFCVLYALFQNWNTVWGKIAESVHRLYIQIFPNLVHMARVFCARTASAIGSYYSTERFTNDNSFLTSTDFILFLRFCKFYFYAPLSPSFHNFLHLSHLTSRMADPSKCPPLTRPSVVAAHAIIKQYIHHTPILTNTTLSTLASTPQSASALEGTPWAGQEPARPVIRLWFKCENLQKVGAFKVRGAFHALSRLIAEEGWEEGGGRQRGVVTHSSGFHPPLLQIHLIPTTQSNR
jgi:hypothetical protein